MRELKFVKYWILERVDRWIWKEAGRIEKVSSKI